MYRFRLHSATGMNVSILHVPDLDTKSQKRSYIEIETHELTADISEEKERVLGHMPILVQQYLMAGLLPKNSNLAVLKGPHLTVLRDHARRDYWAMAPELRTATLKQAQDTTQQYEANGGFPAVLAFIQKNWRESWDNDKEHDLDDIREYLVHQEAAHAGWECIDDDVFLVQDSKLQVVFANVEGLAQKLFGEEAVSLLHRAIDMWSFYTPLAHLDPAFFLDGDFVFRSHPELDPTKATVEELPNAKMGGALYGCTTAGGDANGRDIIATRDTRFEWTKQGSHCLRMMPLFAKAVLGKTSAMMRFLAKPLAPACYEEYVEIFENLPSSARLATDEEGDWLSFFNLGINSRYLNVNTDTLDFEEGLVGLFSVGNYLGGDLGHCQFGVQVPHSPGSCAIIRDGIGHLVQDFIGPRF